MAGYREEALYGRWVHSHEEDGAGEMVFRPETHPFPPSRGRASFDLRPNGTYLESSPGPNDRPDESNGSWSLEDGRLILVSEGDRPGHAWEVAGVDDDRLALKT